ncbi:Uu.00g041340.m01.CDS01 [Anthostomella pinea]|uniref:Uu.00g041340.m01.CDS01 n=1 Tax=Anthostomella pinea TaxID=933095 RepID=A0AAI8VBE2_9PEZI|nr:Uu.00g041340.m01.CDS01 [Anthostomella pinea]
MDRVSQIFLLCYTIFMTIAGQYGFGQSESAISREALSKAMIFESVGQTFSVVAMVTAKCSLGLFYLRLLSRTWHRAVIWGSMLWIACATIVSVLVFWLDCTPPAYFWDDTIPWGQCRIDPVPVAYVLAVSCVVIDFVFAVLPWIFIWKLQINIREKIVFLVSMSLGATAGACGIKRTLELPELEGFSNYLDDTVGLFIWSAAETAVTMICIGIPLCRPLCRNFLDRFILPDNRGFSRHGAKPYALYSIGGRTLHPHCQSRGGRSREAARDQDRGSVSEGKIGLGGLYTETYALCDNVWSKSSDAEMGCDEAQEEGKSHTCGAGAQMICITEEFFVTSSSPTTLTPLSFPSATHLN